MYDESTFKRHILWLRIRRIIIVALYSILGCFVGFIISEMVVDTLDFDQSLRNIIFIVTTLSAFILGFLLTEGTGIAIQDAYWKMAVLRKLTLISIKLDQNPTPSLPEEVEKKDSKKEELEKNNNQKNNNQNNNQKKGSKKSIKNKATSKKLKKSK